MTSRPDITIGVWFYEQPRELAPTLDLLRAAGRARVLVLEDGVRAPAGCHDDIERVHAPQPIGAAACFNRLIQLDTAGVLVFLESGTLMTSGSLDALVAALDTPGCGLAGPSTNRAWNEQRLDHAPGDDAPLDEIERFAAIESRRHRGVRAGLEPLHSLGDFCYVVSRSVVDAIGGADEGYGRGPCWEMEYNIRAARAGFRGLWVRDAYVHRRPASPRRRRDEACWFAASRRRYQDSVCRLHLERVSAAYCRHCEGEACVQFAPPGLRLRREIPSAAPDRPAQSLEAGASLPHTAPDAPPRSRLRARDRDELPLVSCIMPTRDRRPFVGHAVEYFLRQDYPRRELVIVDDGDDDIADLVPRDPRIRHLRISPGQSLGAKRNLGVAESRGALIAHWDDDDWCPPWRLRAQIECLRRDGADLCGLTAILHYEPRAARAWRYQYPSGARPWVAGGTFLYRRQMWLDQPFADVTSGEDNRFVWRAPAPRLAIPDDSSWYVALIHAGNTSPKQTAGDRWRPFPVDALTAVMGADIARYDPARAPGRPRTDRSEPPAGPSVAIAIYDVIDRDALAATLASLDRDAAAIGDIVVFVGESDVTPDRDLLARAGATVEHSERPGIPAVFNQLTRRHADVYLLLESGVRLGPGCLDRLLAALAAAPEHGLAGPSTSSIWNEQAVFAGAGPDPVDIAETACEAAARFADECVNLAPLHSLSDFCYAVRRDVVDAVGPADEGYGAGSCWDMDYNVRAARAGYSGLWVKGAYAYRPSGNRARQQRDARWLASGKQRYQDKFCGARLFEPTAPYRAHCRGDRCADFAPAVLVRPRPPARGAARVSCVMVTQARPVFAAQAIRYFLAQSYPSRELVIVYEDHGDLPALPADDRIVVVRAPRGAPIGGKRNLGNRVASGQFLAQWDDDDWYGPERLARQLAPILAGDADITGLTGTYFFELDNWRFWAVSDDLYARMFVENVHGGTLVYRRAVWSDLAQYPAVSLREDAEFLGRAVRAGARLGRVAGREHFVYVRHGSNTWSFTSGAFLDSNQWRQLDTAPLSAEELAFYRDCLEPRG